MFSFESYYDILYKRLKEHDLTLIEEEDVRYRSKFQYFYELLELDNNIIIRIKRELGINTEKYFLMNSMKFYLACEEFKVLKNKDNIKAAIYFTVLGCVLDKMIDEGNDKIKNMALEKLSWNYCKDYFIEFKDEKEDSVIDYLFQYLGKVLKMMKKENFLLYKNIVYFIERAIDSEVYVTLRLKNDNFILSKYKMNNIDSSENIENLLITDKSILFVVTAFELALFNDKNLDKHLKVIYRIANIFRLIDDLCDISEDYCRKQKNSIFELNDIEFDILSDNLVKKKTSPSHKIDNQYDRYNLIESYFDSPIDKFIDEINLLKSELGSTFFNFVNYEIRDWTMSCKYIRERYYRGI